MLGANFGEPPKAELQRIPLLGTRVKRVGCRKDQKTPDAVRGGVEPRHFRLGRELTRPALSQASVESPILQPLEATPKYPNRAGGPTQAPLIPLEDESVAAPI